MANTIAHLNSSANHSTWLFTGDGTVVSPALASATIIAAMVDGPLKDLFSASYANQAAMRTAVIEGNPGIVTTVVRATGNDVTNEKNRFVLDVDVDAVTAARPEVNTNMSDTTGQIVVVTFHYLHSATR
tara:strand:+ start:1068 stop:1454 length:387 start_codon:yes stop_codon:yes gene_type:complete